MASSIRQTVKQIVETSDTWAGKTFDIFIQLLIFASLADFCTRTLPNLDPSLRSGLQVFEVVAVTIFTIEYSLRVAVADRPHRYMFSFYGLIDLVAILPFYVSLGIDLRALRAVRFFRLFQMFKLMRYSNAVKRYMRALRDIREELIVFTFWAFMVLFFASVGIYYFEGDSQPEAFGSIFHCMWWAIVTLTTVGYGDVYPVTVGGKLFTAVILLVGLGFVAVPTGLFASALTKESS